MDISNLMKEAQKMQQRMQEAQEQLSKLTVEGLSGGGMVSITVNGSREVTKVKIKPSLMEEDVEMMEDLVAAAFNDANRKIEKISKEKVSELTAGLNIPTDFMKKEEE